MRQVFGMAEAIGCAKAAFLALARGEAELPQRLAVRVPEHQGVQLTMPCFVSTRGGEALTVKVATVFEGNPARGLPTTMALLLLQDPETGELLALMDAEYLTAMRTGAASAIATDLLARPDARVLTIFGTGGQAEAQVEGVLAVRQIEQVLIVGRDPIRAEQFRERISKRFGIQATVSDSKGAAIEADVICTATNSVEPVFPAEAIREGTHVNAIGAFRPDMAELPPELLSKSFVVVDRLEAAKAGAGDLLRAAGEGKLEWNSVLELGELLLRRSPFERSPRCTIFKSVGLAVQDAAAASFVYQRAKADGLGQEIRLDGN